MRGFSDFSREPINPQMGPSWEPVSEEDKKIDGELGD